MHAQIEILASLQSVDRQIREQTGLKQGLLGELATHERDIRAKKDEIDQLAAMFGEKEKIRLEKDRVWQEESKKAVDRRMRMNKIKTSKELQALQREIEQIKQSNSELEEFLIQVMEELDGIKANMKTKHDEMAELQGQWQKKQEELRKQISGIDQAVTEAATRRQTIAAQIARDLISRYELIFSRRGGTAVVEVSGGICQGCYMNIPPQLWYEIIRNVKVHLCPSCGRIVFCRAAAAE